ncbi:MAG: CDC48 family AAA ATPase [Nanoarchaeota archaeon]|nr:CDC48 family AAA ATPase [Nanoarchaeota archaeon]MBU4085970.1 CDC48 family AAA ATPase [Nanoarchaeota archaeon]
MAINEVKLKVVEALQDDAYKGIARVDVDVMKKLDLRRGDVIVIKGNRETVAIVDRAYPADIGEPIIRIDGIIRKNAKSGIGEAVSIRKADVKEAKKVTIAPAQKGIMVQGDPEAVKQQLLGRAVVKGDIVVLGGAQRRRDLMSGFGDDIFGDIFAEAFSGMGGFGFGGMQQIRFLVVSATPGQPTVITESTELTLSSKSVEISEEKIPQITYEDVGGLDDETKKVREMVELPLKHPEIFDRLGIEPPKGVLLHGPPGTGKTMLAKAVANESEANFITINGPELMSKFYGESEKNLRDKFEEAEKNAPSIIFIDEIDSIAPKREDSYGEVERRVVSQILTLMDGLKSRGKVVVIGATNRPNAIDPALRRPGRFDRELQISVPDKNGRLAILKIHTRNMPLDKDVSLEELAAITHGFVGADLSSLAKEAAMSVLRKNLPKINLKDGEEIPREVLENLRVNKSDFQEALKTVRPSAMREVLVETPNIGWSDVGGLDKVKQELIEAVEWPLKNPAAFSRMGIRPPRGILLYGPPGTGKTLLAKAVAKESEANFIQVKGPELLSMWVGKSEEGVRKIFERARQVAPCIIFFDEIDSLAARRGLEAGARVSEQVLNQLLAEIDGVEEMQNVTVIGATNRPDMLDPAILRPGRFDRLVLVSPPGKEGRLEVLKIHTKNMPLAKDVIIEKLAEKTEGYVGADIESLCREAALLSLRADMNCKEVKLKHFEKALEKVKASVSKDSMDRYKKMETDYLKSAKAALEAVSYLG